ncbi:MAG: acyltransferase domain-containing protein, partial [Acidobacteriota bacterium]|nr:acyltransferase domain-containing protein [Acidobacteriota bacterium]
HGGIGTHTAAACAAAGAAGVVLDAQLALTRESMLSEPAKAAVRAMDGSETVTVGAELGGSFRTYTRPHLPAAGELAARAAALLADGPATEETRMKWRRAVEERVDWSVGGIWPIGQDAAFAAALARRHVTVAGVLDAIRDAAVRHLETARELRPLDSGSPLAESHGTLYPIVQGPMTRVSDTAEFALKVAEAGGLPFLALALMKQPEVDKLLEETKARLGDKPWGVGILGFVPLELRQQQLEEIHRYKPPFALIAGGRPDQAKRLEDVGIRTYLHVPSPGLLKLFIQDGARRFVFEGRECGGHVGPRSSFVLWNTMIDVLQEELPDAAAEECHVLFAGGIHDARSASMVAAMSAPLARRGVKVGALLGTSYLFTEEAVAAGAIGSVFQRKAVDCDQTVLVESGPGHAVRCVRNPFTDDFEDAKIRLVNEGKSGDEIRQELEELNIGRLRVASKGLKRHPDYRKKKDVPKLVSVDESEQEHDGMFMIGQLAALRRGTTTIAELHEEVAIEGTRRLQPKSDVQVSEVEVRASSPSNVAIIGLSCILPKAPDIATFWSNVVNKVYAIDEIPASRWDSRDYFDADRTARDKIYSKWGGFIDEIEFDPLEFGMPPASLPSIDPMHLLSLVATRDALRDAGYLERAFDRSSTSVILGTSGGSGELGSMYNIRAGLPWLFGDSASARVVDEAGEKLPEWTEDSFAGLLPNVAAGRVANRFDLGGLNFVVDSACASSLTAVHIAVRELEARETDMVITGGVDTTQTPFGFLCFSKTHALSPKGQPRTFDAEADGIAISEGIVMMVLKRVEDAERDGDRIYAVIQAVAGSSDGKAKGLTAPRPEGQESALERAYAKAGFSPKTAELFEAHGTGTVVGDRTEAVSLSMFLERSGASKASHAVGSVKSMIGHTKAAAGVAGLAKVALALHHKVLPPTLGVSTPNPKARLGDGPLYVNSEARPWLSDESSHPRRAGVSAFGFGGTNFHAVVEEYTGAYLPKEAVASTWPDELYLFTGPRTDDVARRVDALESAIAAGAEPAAADLAYSLATRYEAERTNEGLTLAIVASSLSDLRAKLATAREALAGRGTPGEASGIFLSDAPLARDGKVAVLFPGQGSQYPDMLRELALHVPGVRETFEAADRALAGAYERPLSETIFPPPAFSPETKTSQQEALTRTNFAQPALGAADAAMYRILRRCGLRGELFAGHSYGEYVALHAAGVFDERTLAILSEARGRSIIEAAEQDLGTMAAVSASADVVAEAIDGLDGVWLANLNAPRQTILSGTREGLDAATSKLKKDGLSCRPIPVSCAFHSPLVAPAQQRLAAVLGTIEFASPSAPVFSNTTAAAYPDDPRAIVEQLAEHLTNPVRFAEEIEAMYQAGARIFVESGPKTVLSGLVQSILGDRPHVAIATDRPGRSSLSQLLAAMGQLAAHGVALRPSSLFEGRPVRALRLESLAADTAAEPVSPTTWMVHGGKARPHAKPIPPARHVQLHFGGGAPAGATTRVAASGPGMPDAFSQGRSPERVTATPGAIGAPAPGGPTDPATDHVMLGFQELMNRFLETQGRVMTAYLTGEPLPESGLGDDALAHAEDQARALAAFAPPAMPAGSEDMARKAPSAEPFTTEPAAAGPSRKESALPTKKALTGELLRIVSERTGYPTDMLDLEADVEAELGIDSIKRVEIISALQKAYLPDDERQDPEAMERLTAVKSLGGIVEWIVSAVDDVRHRTGDEEPVAEAEPLAAAPSRGELAKELLRIVSERTGYPEEMLDLDADVEAELGIDSIKRVEIIGALRKSFFAADEEQDPEAMEEVTAVKTLGGVVDWIVGTIEQAAGRAAP